MVRSCCVSRLWLGVNVTTDKVLHLDLILMDSKGNDIWVHIPPLLQEKFKRFPKEHHVYVIKNFDINATSLTHRPISNPYIMLFTRKTTVEHITDIPSMPTFKFTFMKASEMANKVEEKTIIADIVGELVQHSTPITTSNIAGKSTRKELQLKRIELPLQRRRLDLRALFSLPVPAPFLQPDGTLSSEQSSSLSRCQPASL
ncbi:unnamed protein product [Linum trigynum]|uniref:Replication protein A 70 kDa DNA-binding subunit B/D first OB fold domain-containing protein n=1 Tax=Linum trigynum TaxID=586398 RepID=A0AAV2FJG1_9ROSI